MAASNSNRTTAEDVPQTDDTESYVEPGPVEPLLETTLKFLTKAGRSLVDHPNFKSSFCAATPSFDKFRLWAFGFNTNGCHLDQLLDENPATREVVVGLVSTFVAIVVAEFSDLCDRDTLRELKDALSQIAVDAGLPPSDDTGTEEPAGHSESISQESTSSCLVPGLEYISNALFELAPVLESTMDVILARRRNQMAVIDLAPLTIYINRIQQRYPDADSRVIERLSRGTLECYLRINSDESNFDPQQRLQHLMSPSAWTETPSVHPHEPKTEFRDSALASSSWRSPHDQQPSNDIVGERGVKRKIDALSGQIVEHPYVAALRHPPNERLRLLVLQHPAGRYQYRIHWDVGTSSYPLSLRIKMVMDSSAQFANDAKE
ncbi:hypothetical protein BDD12DRAFT_809549 [Trichophaea hybrida]|nr:hypothetical protein BDD12DRAFT_809549 [Trichophaea hybrida]